MSVDRHPEDVRWDDLRDAAMTYIKLVRAAESVTSRVHGHLAENGLTVSQFGVLEALYSLGPLCQRDLAAKILKSSGNMTLVIDNLEKKGHVVRERSTTDRRFTIIHLTPSGHEFVENMYPSHVAGIVREMDILTPDEQKEMGRLCRKVGLGRTDGEGFDLAEYERAIRRMAAARNQQ